MLLDNGGPCLIFLVGHPNNEVQNKLLNSDSSKYRQLQASIKPTLLTMWFNEI
jgi:hypothetical protein